MVAKLDDEHLFTCVLQADADHRGGERSFRAVADRGNHENQRLGPLAEAAEYSPEKVQHALRERLESGLESSRPDHVDAAARRAWRDSSQRVDPPAGKFLRKCRSGWRRRNIADSR